jgi:hypothetical protein
MMMLRIRLRPVLCIASIDPSIIHNHYATTQYPLPTTYYLLPITQNDLLRALKTKPKMKQT